MKSIRYISHNENETKKIAVQIASKLNIGDIIVLTGELGSGKTKFTEGFLSFWGLENEISSPTFTIVNEYHAPTTNIYHFDVYRLADIQEFYDIGGLEYFSFGISLIEWGELIEDILPQNYIKIEFSRNPDDINTRYLNISTKDTRLENVIKELKEC